MWLCAGLTRTKLTLLPGAPQVGQRTGLGSRFYPSRVPWNHLEPDTRRLGKEVWFGGVLQTTLTLIAAAACFYLAHYQYRYALCQVLFHRHPSVSLPPTD
jgi:hypothetical protein